MPLSPSQKSEPARDINREGQPWNASAILRGPHLVELVTEDAVPVVMIEPLRFLVPLRLNGRDVFVEPSA